MWTQQVPTEPGFYWYRSNERIEPVELLENGLWAMFGDSEGFTERQITRFDDQFAFWSKPIPTPDSFCQCGHDKLSHWYGTMGCFHEFNVSHGGTERCGCTRFAN